MRKSVVLLLVLALAAAFTAAPAEAKKKKKSKAPYVRVVEGTYDAPALGIGGVLTWGITGGTVEVPTLANENFMQVEVIDDIGSDTYFGVSQEDTNGDGIGEIIYGGCTKTAEPLPITGGLTHSITVTIGPGSEAPNCPGFASSGTIKVTLTENP